MNPRSVQAKGKRFESAVAMIASSLGFGLARRQAGSGNGRFKGDIAWTIPKVAECKNYDYDNFPKLLLKWIEQSEAQALGGVPWVLILRDPRKPEASTQAFAVMQLAEYFTLEMAAKEPKSKAPDKDLKYHLERLQRLAHECMKLAESREDQWKFKDLKMAAHEVIKRFNHV